MSFPFDTVILSQQCHMQFNSYSPPYFSFNCYNQRKYFLICMHFPLCKYMHTDLQKNTFQITRVKYRIASDTTERKKKKARTSPHQHKHKAERKTLRSSIVFSPEQSKYRTCKRVKGFWVLLLVSWPRRKQLRAFTAVMFLIPYHFCSTLR